MKLRAMGTRNLSLREVKRRMETKRKKEREPEGWTYEGADGAVHVRGLLHREVGHLGVDDPEEDAGGPNREKLQDHLHLFYSCYCSCLANVAGSTIFTFLVCPGVARLNGCFV